MIRDKYIAFILRGINAGITSRTKKIKKSVKGLASGRSEFYFSAMYFESPGFHRPGFLLTQLQNRPQLK
jgi:hypothetical protein